MISGGLGAPEAAASALTIRSIAASTRLRTPSSKVRTFSLMIASSGMTFSLVPACSAPMVTTAASVAASSRETMVCSRITVAAAITTGSMLACGIEPCAPRPNSRICRLSAGGGDDPGAPADGTGRTDHDVLAEDHVGLGEAVEQPVVDHRLRAFRRLLRRLEDRHQRPVPRVARLREQRRRADEPGHVHVVAAGVHRPAPSCPRGPWPSTLLA